MKKVTVEGIEFDAPDEANWIAVDEDGLAYWYVDKPVKNAEGGYWDPYCSDSNYGDLGTTAVLDWENSLRKV